MSGYYIPKRTPFETCAQYMARCDEYIVRQKTRSREWARAHKDERNARIRERYANDSEYRVKVECYRERHISKDPEGWRELRKARMKHYNSRPEVKERKREWARAHKDERNARIRERYANDSEYRAKLKDSNKRYAEKTRMLSRQAREFWRGHEKSACEYMAWFSGGEDDFFDDLDRRLGLKG